MTVDIATLRALLSAASPATWERVDPDGQPTAKVGYCIVSGGIERSHIAAEWRGDAAIVALRNAASGMLDELEEFRSYQPYTAALEECAQMRDELESLRKWCKASIDADQVLCAENERLRRFRDVVMAERDAALKVDGVDAETEEAHDLLCDALDEVIDEERVALAKENGNG